MPKFLMAETVGTNTITARVSGAVGDTPMSSIFVDYTERGKFVKLGAESRYVLAALGDEIETVIESVNTASQDGWSIAGLRDCSGTGKHLRITFDGLQATPGVGTATIGSYVLVGTTVARGTPLSTQALSGTPRVVVATNQANAKATPFAWRIVSLGTAGTGAPGTTGVIQRVGA